MDRIDWLDRMDWKDLIRWIGSEKLDRVDGSSDSYGLEEFEWMDYVDKKDWMDRIDWMDR